MPGTQHTGPRTRRVFTTFGVGLALFLVLGAFTAACMSDDDPGDSGDINVQITANSAGNDDDDASPVLATFTPVPPNFTPEVVQTRDTQRTAAALTATAQLTATSVPSVATNAGFPSPSGTVPFNVINPPDTNLVTNGGVAPGAKGSYNYYDLRLNRGAEVTTPYVILPDGGAPWATGTEARLEVVESPYPVTSAEVKFYTFDGNVALPTDQSGNPGDTPAFYPQTAPVRQLTVAGEDITLTPEVAPGRYIVEMRVNWSTPVGLNPLWTQYIFIVDVV